MLNSSKVIMNTKKEFEDYQKNDALSKKNRKMLKNEDLENLYINAMKYTMHTISKKNYLLHPSTLLPFTVFIQFP